jgi:predicted ArsR family transcriptional regulator
VSPAPADRILHLLKTKGPATAASLARRLGVTPPAVRQHLQALERDGLLEHEDRAGQVGRPKRVWRTTRAADGRFPDSHAELAVALVASVRGSLGEQALARVVAERTRRQAVDYERRLPPRDRPLPERLAALAKIRRDEGYLAAVETDGDGGLLLVENHCPICAAATACTGLCDGELDLFRRVLGPGVRVTRTEHLLAGARRCAYRVEPTRAPRARA